MDKTLKLKNRTALITGGGGAIGGASAKLMAAEGAAVVVADVQLEAAEKISNEIKASGGRAKPIYLDVADEDQVNDVVSEAINYFGSLNILLNVAAAVTPDASVENLSLSEWNRAFSVNLTGPFLMAKYSIPFMRAAGGGVIVNIASQLGKIGVPNRSAYCSTKAALIHLTTILASEVACDNIRVNSLSPGVIETPRTLRRFEGAEQFREARGPLHMLGRVGKPEEVAKAVLFLATDDSSFTTATDLLVDGGYSYLKRTDNNKH